MGKKEKTFEAKFYYLANTIRIQYEQLSFTLQRFVINSRNSLSDNKYGILTPIERSSIDAQITKSPGFITIRIKMLLLEDIADENNLYLNKWHW